MNSLENELNKIAFSLFYEFFLWDFDLEHSKKNLNTALNRWYKYLLPALKEEHRGDCTKEPMSCARCIVEEYFFIARDVKEKIESARYMES
jgi:hypothetical protein